MQHKTCRLLKTMHNSYNESFHIQGIKVQFLLLKNECLECSWINFKYIFTFLLSKKKKWSGGGHAQGYIGSTN